MSIQIEVIPESCVGRNLHSYGIIQPVRWRKLSKQVRVLKRFCHGCGKKYGTDNLHTHEIWRFDENRKVQVLDAVVTMCEECHSTTHLHFLMSNKDIDRVKYGAAKVHYMRTNKCSADDFERDLNNALKRRQILNQITGGWAMDISYTIKEGLLSYEEINIGNLENCAPGSKVYLEPYRPKQKLFFNDIPTQSLVDKADSYHEERTVQVCQICRSSVKRLYNFYDLRVQEGTQEMYFKGVKTICSDCRKTIYTGPYKLFLKHRKTTKHFMRVNHCSFDICEQQAMLAKLLRRQRRKKLVYYFPNPDEWLPKNEFEKRNQYLKERGAQYDGHRKQWYLRPVKNLNWFYDFL